MTTRRPWYLGKVALAAKIMVSLLLLAFVMAKLDWTALKGGLTDVQWWLVVSAVCLQFMIFVVANVRWWLLIRTHRLGHTFGPLLRLYLIGAFFNNLLPTSAGGDLLRMYYIYRQGHGGAFAVSPVITERIVGVATLIGLAALAVTVLPGEHRIVAALSAAIPLFFLGAVSGLALIGGRCTYWPLHRFFERWQRLRPVSALLHVAEASHGYLSRPRLVLSIVLVSVAIQLGEVVVFYVLGKAVGAPLGFMPYLLVVPLVLAAAALPVSIGGLGVREAAALALFVAMGMSQPDAAAVSILFVPVLLLGSLPGLGLFLAMKDHHGFYRRATHTELV